MTRTAIVALAFSCLMAASCSSPTKEPVIDSSSIETYRNSLLEIGIPLTSEDRLLLSEAITIIKVYSSGIAQLGPEENIRMKLSGLTSQQIIDKAKQLVLDWFYEHRESERRFYKDIVDVEKQIDISKTDQRYVKSMAGSTCYFTVRLSNQSTRTVTKAEVSVGDVDLVFTNVPPGEAKTIGGECKGSSTKSPVFMVNLMRVSGIDADVSPWGRFDNHYGPDNFHRFLDRLGLAHRPYKFIENLPKPLPPKSPKK
jgi:hypothetical protein